ncbi:MAG: glycosyltransferase family 41 protein [Burkholderiales bacterium]|nr:MAG: glycosyltransferase family 41 protein [Burkholderiales bacterium]
MKAARAPSGACAGLLQRAAAKLSGGQAAEAAQLLAQAVQQFPREPEPWLRLGNLLAGAGHWTRAERCYAERCALRPASAQAFYNWGVALSELGRPSDALSAYARSLALRPDDAATHHASALSHAARQDFGSALPALDRAVALAPDRLHYRVERARVRVRMGQPSAALADLDGLPDDPDALNLRGIALRQLHRPADALACYDQALALRPGFVEALNNRGNLRLLQRRFSAALDDLDQALVRQPDADWLPGLRLYAAMHLYDWRDLPAQLERLRQGVSEGRRVIQPLALQGLVDDPALQQQAARLWARHSFAPRADWQPGAVTPGGRIRVAYLSRDFRAHPVSFLMAEVIELHDRSRFEVIALSYGPATDDPLRARLRAAFDDFIDVESLSDAQVADLARARGVDVLVDLTGLTDGARTGILAWRPAPVQMLYLGTLGTSGSPVFDYLLADAITVPPETRAAHDECIVWLPSYQANDRRRPRPSTRAGRIALGLPVEAMVYCCFNNPCKITPEQFASWAEILHGVPGSVLWVLDEDPQAAAHLRGHAEAAGLAPGRLVLARRMPREHYLAALAEADLFLDTLPYNAGTTASDALWMGLPVLSLPGRAFAARVAASLLHAAGLPELIATDRADYVRRAVQLGRDAQARAALRKRLAGVDQSLLFDTPRFTRHLEQAYALAHARRLAGQPPADLSVPPISGSEG